MAKLHVICDGDSNKFKAIVGYEELEGVTEFSVRPLNNENMLLEVVLVCEAKLGTDGELAYHFPKKEKT